jgi:hypothetical protein
MVGDGNLVARSIPQNEGSWGVRYGTGRKINTGFYDASLHAFDVVSLSAVLRECFYAAAQGVTAEVSSR